MRFVMKFSLQRQITQAWISLQAWALRNVKLFEIFAN